MPLCYVFPFMMMIHLMITIIQFRPHLRRRMFIPLLLNTLLPFIATIAQFFLYGLSLTNLTFVWMVILLYHFALIDMDDAIQEAKERELLTVQDEEKRIYYQQGWQTDRRGICPDQASSGARQQDPVTNQ